MTQHRNNLQSVFFVAHNPACAAVPPGKLIEQCGWRRKEELEDAEEAAKNW
jgi:S-ribosylhomocysteine lyase LuxS involved in autoinducer biosynthesis